MAGLASGFQGDASGDCVFASAATYEVVRSSVTSSGMLKPAGQAVNLSRPDPQSVYIFLPHNLFWTLTHLPTSQPLLDFRPFTIFITQRRACFLRLTTM